MVRESGGVGRREVLRVLSATTAGAWLQSIATPARAAVYPDHTLRILLGYAPGGSADVLTRLVAERLSVSFDQSVIVENRPGASGNIAGALEASAAPDGYTLLSGNPAEIVINRFTAMPMTFNPDVDFIPIVRMFNIPLALTVPANSPFRSLDDLLTAARAAPNQVTFASAGAGSPGHLAGEMLAFGAKVQLTHVPYRGGGPALSDLLGGHVASYMAGFTAVAPLWQSGQVRVLAISSGQRSRLAPSLPTIAELALPGFDYTAWGGLFAVKKTPAAVITRVNQAVNAAFDDPAVVAKLAAQQSEAEQNSSAQFAAFVKSQAKINQQIIKLVGYRGV